MNLFKVIRDWKDGLEYFFAKRKSEEEQVMWAIDLFADEIEETIKNESRDVTVLETETSLLYFQRLKETLRILRIVGQETELEIGLSLYVTIADTNQFFARKQEVIDFVHNYHPIYIKLKYELLKVRVDKDE